jgi:hypothetical protein
MDPDAGVRILHSQERRALTRRGVFSPVVGSSEAVHYGVQLLVHINRTFLGRLP